RPAGERPVGLSGRATPLSAAGATQDIQSLDRVLVELKARDGAGALGDIPLAVTRGEFARLERRVQGVSGEWRPGAFVVRAAAAGGAGAGQPAPRPGGGR